jgi:hypothetical protein
MRSNAEDNGRVQTREAQVTTKLKAQNEVSRGNDALIAATQMASQIAVNP